MKTRNMTKLIFAGVAAGLALSTAVVVATTMAVTPMSPVDTTSPVSTSDTRSDLGVRSTAPQEVVRNTKTDALDIVISILKGSDTEFGDRIAPTPTDAVTSLETEPVSQPVENTLSATAPEAPAATAAIPSETAPTVEAAPVVRNVQKARSGPTNIIPVPSPTGNLPATAPAGSTSNITADPFEENDTLPNRQDLQR